MQFMIDFENTGSAGLRGASFLLPEDTVTIFYSESSDKAESGFMSDLFASAYADDINYSGQARIHLISI